MPADAVHPDTRPDLLRAGSRTAAVAEPAGSTLPGPTFAWALVARMRGPGGCYNLGNVFALAAGLVVQMISMPDGAARGLANFPAIAGHYLFGSPGSTTLSVSLFIFLIAGELYHRAWANGSPPDARLNYLGDLLSGVASVVLTVALVIFGDIFLAIISGVLLAGGKFGSAFVKGGPLSFRFRQVVLLSRLPAVAALGVQFLREVASATPETPVAAIAMPVVMILSYLLWARADWLLLKSAPATAENARAG